MKTQLKHFLVAALVAAFLPISLNAQRGQRYYGEGPADREPGWRMENIIPDLTEEQAEQLQDLRLERLKVRRDHRNQMGELRARQRTLMSENPIDQKAMEKLIDSRAELMKAQQKARLDHQVRVRSILTEEQVLVLNERMQKYRMKAGRRGPGQGYGQGRRFKPGRGYGQGRYYQPGAYGQGL